MSQQTPDVLDDMIVLTKKGRFSKNRGCTFLFQTIGPCLFLSQQFLDSETPFFSSYSAVKVHADIESIRKGCFLLDHYPATRYMQPLSHCSKPIFISQSDNILLIVMVVMMVMVVV